MEKQINIWIYCRVAELENIELLHFQADLLSKYAHQCGYLISGLSKEVDDGFNLNSKALKLLINSIVDEDINAVLVYSKNRLLRDEEALENFELICLMHNVSIITYKNDSPN